MKRAIRLIIEEPGTRADRVIASARIEHPRGGHDTLWFSVPREQDAALTTSADPFIVATFLLAMSRGRDLRVEGEASPVLLRNLEAAQDYYTASWPAFYRKIAIGADRLSADETKQRAAMIAFSGGMDCCHTLFRHVKRLGPAPFHDIRGAVMVQGLDIPLSDRDGFSRAAAQGRIMTGSLGVPLVEVATNLRELPLIWEHGYGPGIACVLHLFARRYGYGLVASSHQVRGNILGSHPDVDPLYTSGCFEIVHDSAFVHKLEKAAMLKDWPEAMRHMRVCWEGRDRAANCCRCEKCIRTILIFRANGFLPPCFSRDVTDEEIRTMRILTVNINGTYIPMLALLKERGIRGSWVDALEENVARHVKHPYRKPKDYLPAPLVVRLYQTQARWREIKRLIARG